MRNKTTANQVADRFLSLAKRQGEPMDHLKLQKLVYLALGWYAALTGKRLFDDPVEAWRWGPVIPSIWHRFKENGSSPIPSGDVDSQPLANDYAERVVDRVYSKYGGLRAWQLSDMTHEPETPWSESWAKSERGIPWATILNHFKILREKIRADRSKPSTT